MGTTNQTPGMQVFLVERYWPGIRREELADAEERVRRTLAQLAQEGVHVRIVSSTFLPTEEVVLTHYEARHEDDVIEASRRSGVPFDRVQPVEFSQVRLGRGER